MENKSKGDRTKQRIIEDSARLFLIQGYSNTGISSILDATKLPKGSFYFHFQSKKELGMAVAQYFQQEYSQWFQHFVDTTDTWESFVSALTDDILNKIERNEYFGCPFSCFGTEASAVDPDIARICTAAIQGFVHIFAHALESRHIAPGHLYQKAAESLSLYEGFLVSYRISRSPAVISAMKQGLLHIGGDYIDQINESI